MKCYDRVIIHASNFFEGVRARVIDFRFSDIPDPDRDLHYTKEYLCAIDYTNHNIWVSESKLSLEGTS